MMHGTLGIRDYLDQNPINGEMRSGPRRFWTGREEKILRQVYPEGGVPACVQALPGRSAASIYNHAGQLGLRKKENQNRERQQWASNERFDELIRRAYQRAPSKGDIKQLAATLGRPRWWIRRRAQVLGLAVPRFREPPWSEREMEIASELAHRNFTTIRRALKREGFDRTETAISVKLKRLGACRDDPNVYNANGVAICMGVDRKTVARWIAENLLKARKRGTAPSEERDLWVIHRKDIRAFIVEHTAHFDIRKVDKDWFVDLLAA